MATSDIALERVQALLKVDTGDGSLYTHVVRIARAMAAEKPDQALAQLETLSWKLKKAGFRGASGPDPAQDIVADAAAEEKRQQWCADALQLVRPPSDPLAAPKVLAAVQNVMEDASMLEWAGVGFGKQEWYHIAMSLRKLAADTERLEKLRLWGKIMGTHADYYVAEGSLELPAVDPAAAAPEKVALPGMPEFDVEPRGEGANTNTYWVSAGGAAPWVRLPAARASHVVASRKIKHMLTGDLGSPVLSMPWFPGKERHLLRAQIARITSTCTLAVAGYFEKWDDETKKLMLPESDGPPAAPEPSALAVADGWVHAAPSLLSIGKCSWPSLDGLEDGDVPEEVRQDKQDNEAPKDMLAEIKGDLSELAPEDDPEALVAWNIKVYGDKGKYTFAEGDKSYRVTAVRSMIWPGSITVAQGNRFSNLYVGNALKSASLVPPQKESGLPLPGASPFSSGNVYPLEPEDVMEEPEDQQEEQEPQPETLDDASDGGEMDKEEGDE